MKAGRRLALSAFVALSAVVGCAAGSPLGSGLAAAAGPLAGSPEEGMLPWFKGQRDLTSAVTGDAPNFAQFSNGRLMTVVSRDFGRGAKAGALVEMYYPHMAHDQLWDSYVGVTSGGKLKWAHDLRLLDQALEPDAGIAVSSFRGPGYELTIADLARPKSDCHVRRVTVRNDTLAPLSDVAVNFYAYFTLGHLPVGDRLWRDPATGALVQEDSGTGVAILADMPADAWHIGQALYPFGDKRDARIAAEAGTLSGNTAAGPFPSGVNGVLRYRLGAIGPAESRELLFVLAAGSGGPAALVEAKAAQAAAKAAQAAATVSKTPSTGSGDSEAAGSPWNYLAAEDREHWAGFLREAHMPARLPEDARPIYRRALITLAQHVTDEGAILAAPTALNPPYRFVWPRDSTYIALALAEAGFPRMAERALGFLERVQKASGEFAVNYFADASRPLWDFGTDGNEHDQPASLAWGAVRLGAITGDQAWLDARWPAVRRSCEFLIGVQRADGLLGPCRDLWELDTDGTWTYSNGAAWAGLQAGAALADRKSAPGDAARYRAAADRLRQAMESKLVVSGRFARGLRGTRVDPVVEAANLALGSPWFGVFPDVHPLLSATGRAVSDQLTSPWGGIRRYEGDRYYDGQPWPVATAWLALHQLELGDRPGAVRLFDTLTRYARETDSLMLGEQFDESRQRWVSAMPLAWSEAMYVKTALALYK